MARYKVLLAAKVARDLDLIEDHLVDSYRQLGDDLSSAIDRAFARIVEALKYAQTFERHPNRGAGLPEIDPNLRTITHQNFVFYFEIDEQCLDVKILAIFFGAADHRRQIRERL